jgi:hypothetical protein
MNEDQPRVPAGSPEGGEWTSENSGGYTSPAYRQSVMDAGRGMMSRSTPAQQGNHAKVLQFAETLKAFPSAASPETAYKELMKEYVAVHIKGQPAGTGAYDLTKK